MVLPAQHLLCRVGVLKRGNSMTDQELAKIANEVRRGIVTGVHAAKSGHPGGSLGAADIMTYLYFEEMDVDPANPSRAEHDRFVLSKGHCAPALYAVLAERGFFPKEAMSASRASTFFFSSGSRSPSGIRGRPASKPKHLRTYLKTSCQCGSLLL